MGAYPQEIFVDNKGAIQLAKNLKFHERTKHIGVRYHFVRDACERNVIKTTYLPTSEIGRPEAGTFDLRRGGGTSPELRWVCTYIREPLRHREK